VDRREFFDGHAKDWDGAQRPELSPQLERVIAAADLRRGHRVLDLGSGTGVLIPHVLRALEDTGQVVAVDISPEMLVVARSKRFPLNVSLVAADAEAMPLPDEWFHRVICNAAFPHFPDRQQALAEMFRVLRRDGLLIISHPIGREAVNAKHREAHGVIAEDRVPPAAEMQRLLRDAGFADIAIVDEPEFYLAAGRRPNQDR
jgi:ubiquinone/menaquinone biosynthesis C-methylase UbiE